MEDSRRTHSRKGKEGKGKDPWSLTSEYLLADRGQDPSRDDEELPPVGQRTRAAREVAGLATGAAWSDAACDRAIAEAAKLHPEASERQLHDAFIVHALWVKTISPNRFRHVAGQALREAKLDVEAVHDWRARQGPLDRPALEDAS